MNQQSKKFFVKHGNNEFTYYGSRMSMHMGSGAILVHNDLGEIVGAHKEWDCAYEISSDVSHMEQAKANGIAGLTASEIYMKMQKERTQFANDMLDSIVKPAAEQAHDSTSADS